jgi:putative DNA primase/helicase
MKSAKESVIDILRARFFVPSQALDGCTNLINLKNGVFSFESSTLYPHKESYFFTTQLPFSYDVYAQCPKWQYYLMTTFVKPQSKQVDLELIEFIQEAIGYSLTTDVSHHVTFWCYGTGRNGKGVLFHVLEQLSGPAFTTLNIRMLRQNVYQLAELPGKCIATCSESSATDNLVEDGTIKALVAGDTIKARSPNRRPFDLHPTVKIWWSMNTLPAVADTSEGFWRRVQVVPFNRQFSEEEQIKDLKEQLDLELSGIFNWAMVGLRRLKNRGKFRAPRQVTESTEQYRRESNPVALFVEDNLFSTKDETRFPLASAVYSAYKSWCLENTYRPVSSRRFKREMETLEVYTVRKAVGMVYEGFGLKSAF